MPTPPPPVTRRAMSTNCLAGLFWSFNFGLGAPLASLWLQDHGHSATVIGLNTGVYYLGIALAAGIVPWMMRRFGRGCPVLGMVASGLSVALFPWGGGLFGWFLLRLLNGVGGALSLIPMETFVNHASPHEHRARNFGFYAFSVALGIALGTLVGMQMYSGTPRLAFVLGGVVPFLSVIAILGGVSRMEAPAEEDAKGTLPVGRIFLSLGSAWSQGFLEGGMIALLPIYLLAIGLTDSAVGWLMSGMMMGVIGFQVPVAWLADRLGRTNVLLGCYAVTAVSLVFMPFCTGSAWLALWLFLAGACSAAFYPLGLALLGEKTPRSGLARANAWYLGINCVGSLTGPVCCGIAMDEFGRRALFVAGEMAVVLVLVAWVIVRPCSQVKDAKGLAETQSHFDPAEREAA